jgi:high affinity Mn2+ porin
MSGRSHWYLIKNSAQIKIATHGGLFGFVYHPARGWIKTTGRIMRPCHLIGILFAVVLPTVAPDARAQDTNGVPATVVNTNVISPPRWNLHLDNTDVVQWHPSFPAQYSGPNSLSSQSEAKETITFDVTAGFRLWEGAEFHVDGLAWQGYGLSRTFGVEAFPNAEAYKVGAPVADATFSRVFIRQTIGLGGTEETVADDPLHLAGKVDSERIVLTLGEMNVLDIFDHNAYASDPESQFLNWALVGNEAWDYPANSLGYITGFAAEWYEPGWALRYGFFQMPERANGLATDPNYLEAWGMVIEAERDFQIASHPGVVRLLGYLNRAHMGSYQEAVEDPERPAVIPETSTYHSKYGLGLNIEQELFKNVGAFMRLGWSDGDNQSWVYADVDRSGSMGISVNGDFWNRPHDTFGLAGVINGITSSHQQYLADGGLGILAGDGALNYGLEKTLETYYNFQVYKSLHITVDYQYVIDPAYNRARGPVSVLGGRLHWEF